ncbi:hypothetical protein Taro_047250 [Colocasia esculenta]|uniref:RING-type E3 ubiquitin transferase n=1 Tax=Colocasia esculenta TaxID=4460 RepID=A0A843X7V0_COLES|nr:hypothetical protein [Colocasia esculenta]
MGWITLEANQTQQSPPYMPPPPPFASSHGGLDGDISPSILLIIVILSVIFFISGLLHLLVRLLLRPASRDPEESDNVTALQGQLQQLFHLHDAGVDQSFIDALPVFLYKAIIGSYKDPFDCAVCLCEFGADDKLRLLPRCSHAFHLECIDTWLLSHSTCPLCRSSLLPDASPARGCSPLVLVLESGSESSREIVPDRGHPAGGPLALHSEEEPSNDPAQKAGEGGPKEDRGAEAMEVVPVKLGKFRNVDISSAVAGGEVGTGSSTLDERRCFSMGSFEYVMDEASILHVAIQPLARKPGAMKPRHRDAMSECDCHSQREGFKGFEPPGSAADLRGGGGIGSSRAGSNSQRKESFSVSKIWLRPRKEGKPATEEGGSRQALSFRLPLQRGGPAAEAKGSSRRTAEADVDTSSEFSFDVEAGSCDGRALSRAGETPSFARRTLLWIVGRHHKVVNHV